MDLKIALLKDLQAVAKKYDVKLSACGCCDGFHASHEGNTLLAHMNISPTSVSVEEVCVCEGGADDLCRSCGKMHCTKCTGRDICLSCLYSKEE